MFGTGQAANQSLVLEKEEAQQGANPKDEKWAAGTAGPQESSEEIRAGSTSPNLGELLAELKSFYDLVAEECSTLQVLLQLLPHPSDIHDASPEEACREIMELIADVMRVGTNLAPTLDRLLRLTERMLQNNGQS